MDELNRLMGMEDSLERARALYERVFTREDERLSGSLWLERMTTLHVLGQASDPAAGSWTCCGTGVRPAAGKGRHSAGGGPGAPPCGNPKSKVEPGWR